MSFLDALTGRLPGLVAAGFAGRNVAERERYRREQAAMEQARQQQQFEADMRRKVLEESMLKSRLERQPTLDQREDAEWERRQTEWGQKDRTTDLALQTAEVQLQQARTNLANTRTPEQEQAAKLEVMRAEAGLRVARNRAAAAASTGELTNAQTIQLLRDAGTMARDTEDTFTNLKRNRPTRRNFTDDLGVTDTTAYNAAVRGFQADSSRYAARLAEDQARYRALVESLTGGQGPAAAGASSAPSPAPAASAGTQNPVAVQLQREAAQVVQEILADSALSPQEKNARVAEVGRRLAAEVSRLLGAP